MLLKTIKFALNRTLMDIKEGLSDMERNETVDEIEIEEKKGKDHDGDGDVDGDDYMHAKDKAIKKAMGKDVNAVYSKRKQLKVLLLRYSKINQSMKQHTAQTSKDMGKRV